MHLAGTSAGATNRITVAGISPTDPPLVGHLAGKPLK